MGRRREDVPLKRDENFHSFVKEKSFRFGEKLEINRLFADDGCVFSGAKNYIFSIFPLCF